MLVRKLWTCSSEPQGISFAELLFVWMRCLGFEHSYEDHGFVESFGIIKYVMVEHELTQLTLELSIPALINSFKPS